ncbi:MAG: histidine utilization repressor [Thiolinea sp.]
MTTQNHPQELWVDTRPRYQQIKQFISDAIRNQVYAAGDKIPTEAELVEQFGVSRMTVNKALRDLVQEGLLVRYPGLGTFVAQAKAESPLADVRNIAEEVRARGHHYSSQVLELKEQSATEPVAMQLGIPLHSRVFHSLIVHHENQLPIQLEERFVSAQVLPNYLQQDFTQTTPNQYLSEQYALTAMEHIVEAVLPNKHAQHYLGLAAHLPCLQVSRRTWSGERLISFAILTHPGDRYKLRSMVSLPTQNSKNLALR